MSEVYSVPEVEPLPDRLQQKLMNLAEKSDKVGPRVEYEALATYADLTNIAARKGMMPEVAKTLSPVAEVGAKASRVAGGAVDIGLKPLGLLAIPVGLGVGGVGLLTLDARTTLAGAAIMGGGMLALRDPVRRTEIAVFQGVRSIAKGTEKAVDTAVSGAKTAAIEGGRVASTIVDRIVGKFNKADVPAAAV